MKRSKSRRSLLAAVCVAGILPGTTVAAQTGSPPQEPPPETRSPVPLSVPDLEEIEDDRLSFSYPMPEARGGGTVSGRAGSLEQPAPQQVVLRDEVELRYKDLVVQADRVELDLESNQVRASGHIVLDQGPRRVSAEALEFDLDNETGTFYDATGYLDPDFYFRGKTVEKVGENAYVVRNGVFTSCSAEVPEWSFRVARARVTVDGYARATHTALRIKKLPILYLPYILWPVKAERTSGFLIPDIGYSDHRGTELGLAYFQTFGNSFDATLHLDLYERNFRGYGTDVRYRPTEGTSGSLRGYWIEKRDEAGEGTESRLDFVHDSRDLPGGLRGVLRVTDYSSFDFFAQQFERQITNLTRRSIYSSGYLTGSWGAHSLNLLVDQRETFSTVGGESATTTQRQLPELEYGLRTRQIGRTPLYFSLRSSAHVFDIEPRDPAADPIQYERTHWVPELSLPFSRLPWLSMTASVQERFTWYSDSLDPETRAFGEDAESLSRAIPNAGLEIVGPSFSRIYDREAGSFAGFKHVVEPRITYSYDTEFEDQDQIPLFDEIDQLGASRNIVTVAVVNRLLAKPKPPRELREAIEAAEAEAETEDDEAVPGEEALAAGGFGDEEGDTMPEPAGDEMLPSVTDQLDREEDLADGITGATGAFDTLSQQAALMAATTPREILSFQVAQARTFEEVCPLERAGSVRCPLVPVEESDVVQPGVNLWGPVVANLRFNPSSRVSLVSQVNYSPLFAEVTSASLSSGLSFGRYAQHNVGVTWYTQFNQRAVDGTDNREFELVEGTNQLRLLAGVEVWPGRLRLGTRIDYNILGFRLSTDDENTTRHIQSQSYSLTYTGQCYAFDLSYYERQFSGDLISEIRFAVSLKNVGTLLDLKSGLSSSY